MGDCVELPLKDKVYSAYQFPSFPIRHAAIDIWVDAKVSVPLEHHGNYYCYLLSIQQVLSGIC